MSAEDTFLVSPFYLSNYLSNYLWNLTKKRTQLQTGQSRLNHRTMVRICLKLMHFHWVNLSETHVTHLYSYGGAFPSEKSVRANGASGV